MFRMKLAPVWIGVIFVAGAFLMGANPTGCERAPVAKTGQTTSYYPGDDGDLERGVAWPDPRFTDNLNGTVTDELTGLVWTKEASCHSGDWYSVLDFCNALADGTCGLTDGSVAGDWRLANRFELESLLAMGTYFPALPGHPFTHVPTDWYWSSTTYAGGTSDAWLVGFDGDVNPGDKDDGSFAWCVQGGR